VTETKRCTKCGEVKPLDEFHTNNRRPDGRNTQCKVCRNASRARGPTFPELHDPVWLKQRYQVDLLTQQEIADRIGCSASAVSFAIQRTGIPWLPRGMREGFRARLDRECAEGAQDL